MRIAYFLPEFPVLSQTFILNQITGMIDLGAEVELFAFEELSANRVHPIVNEYQLLGKVVYLNRPRGGKLGKVARFLALLASSRSMSILIPTVRALNARKFGRAASSLQLPLNVLQCGPGRVFDIIHCQFGSLAPRVLDLIEVGSLNGKLVTSFRGFDATMYVRQHPGVYDYLFHKGDLFLPVSQSLRRAITELGCPESRIKVLHSGIQTDHFTFRQKTFPEDGVIKVITIARLVPKKGVDIGIRSVAKAILAGKRLHYSIVGDGVLLEKLKELVDQLGVANEVSFLGWKTHEDILGLLSDSHILVAPSVTADTGDQEGIPNVMKEAMAVGLPVIGTLHGGIPELVEHGRTGFLVAERDVDSLAGMLVYLCEHPEVWATVSMEARRFVEAEFDSARLNENLLEIYRALIVGENKAPNDAETSQAL
jgi:colanic acid/amylovoran biosynthesis glycosyltransferase